MGKRVDRAALGALCAVGYYLFFLYAWNSVPVACGAAFIACALTRRLCAALPRRHRASRAQAWAALMRIAEMDEPSAQEAMTALLRRRYPGGSFSLSPVLKHPEASLSSGDILNAWKANRGAERLVVGATCPCEPRAAQYARELTCPAVAVADSRVLTRLLRIQPPAESAAPPRVSPATRLRRALARVGAARVSWRDGLLAGALMAGYLFGGNPYSLFAALAVLAHIGVALAQRRTGRRLFEGTS